MDLRKVAIFVVMDGLLLAELTFCIWLAHFDMSTVAWTFLKWFLPMAAATALGARWALRRLPPRVNQAAPHRYRPVGLFGRSGGEGYSSDDNPAKKV